MARAMQLAKKMEHDMTTITTDLDLSNDTANCVAATWLLRLGVRLGGPGPREHTYNQVEIQEGTAPRAILEYVAAHPEIGFSRFIDETCEIPEEFARAVTGHADREAALVDALRTLWKGDADVLAKFAAAGVHVTEAQIRIATAE